jgi:hypothetical protein
MALPWTAGLPPPRPVQEHGEVLVHGVGRVGRVPQGTEQLHEVRDRTRIPRCEKDLNLVPTGSLSGFRAAPGRTGALNVTTTVPPCASNVGTSTSYRRHSSMGSVPKIV